MEQTRKKMATTTFDENLIGGEDADASAQKKSGASSLTPGGFMMLFIAGIFDLVGYISIGFYLLFGFGLVLGRVASIAGFIIIGTWMFFRSGSLPTPKSKNSQGAASKLGKKLGKKIFKKHWKKITLEAIPGIGDAMPSLVWMVWSELNS